MHGPLIQNNFLGNAQLYSDARMYNEYSVQIIVKNPSPDSVGHAQFRAEMQTARSIDCEILGYFAEEAKESLKIIANNIDHLTEDPCGIWYLPSIHRQIKTLRENGEMIGMLLFHEATSQIEPLVLSWLRQGLRANNKFLVFMRFAHTYISEWVRCIESDQCQIPDNTEISAHIHTIQSSISENQIEPPATSLLQA